MCRQANLPTLNNEIETTVRCLVGTKTKFSAFDVTKDVRSRVSDGATSIDTNETGTVFVGGKSVAKVDHEIVKEAVHDIFGCGEMTDYDRTHNGEYWEYHEKVDEPDDDDDSGDDPGPSADGDDYDGSPSFGN